MMAMSPCTARVSTSRISLLIIYCFLGLFSCTAIPGTDSATASGIRPSTIAPLQGLLDGLEKFTPPNPFDRKNASSGESDPLCEQTVEGNNVLEALGRSLLRTLNPYSMQTRGISMDAAKDNLRAELWLPVSAESYIGGKFHEIAWAERARPDPKAQQMVDLLNKGFPASPYTFKVFSSPAVSEQVMAMALPGGYIYVSPTLSRSESPEVWFSLAHEMSHATKRHMTRRLQRAVVDGSDTWKDLHTNYEGLIKPENLKTDRVVAYLRSLTSYNNFQEQQADACAVHVLSASTGVPAGDAVRAAAAEFRTRKQANHRVVLKINGRSFELWGDAHPDNANRVAHIEKAVSRYSLNLGHK